METSDNKHLENYGDPSNENDEYWEKEKQIKVHEFFVIGGTLMMFIVGMFDWTMLTCICLFLSAVLYSN